MCITGICYHYVRNALERFLVVYVWSMGWFTAALASGISAGEYPGNVIMDLALIVGVVFLGAGFIYYKKKDGHIATMIGWQGLGIYWTLEVPNYVGLHPDDPINVILYAPALALFTVFCYHEWDTYKGAEPKRALKFMAGLTFIGAGTYFAFSKIALLSTVLIWIVAGQTSWLYNLTGATTYLGVPTLDPGTGEVTVPIIGASIAIILACTGIEAMVIFLGAFLAIEPKKNPWKSFKKISPRMKRYMLMSPRERRVRALLYTIPPIWVLNLVRNISIIYLVDNQITDFATAHGYLGKSFSFLVLLALAMIVFDLMPEIYDDLTALYRLGRPEKKKDKKGKGDDKEPSDGKKGKKKDDKKEPSDGKNGKKKGKNERDVPAREKDEKERDASPKENDEKGKDAPAKDSDEKKERGKGGPPKEKGEEE